MNNAVRLSVWIWLVAAWSACGPAKQGAVFVTIEDWTHIYRPASQPEFPINVKTLGELSWEGAVKLWVQQGDSILSQTEMTVSLEASQDSTFHLSLMLPELEGKCELIAELQGHQNQPVRNRRLILIQAPKPWELEET